MSSRTTPQLLGRTHRARVRPQTVCEQLEARRLLSAGDADPSFSGDGKVLQNLSTGLADDGRDVAVQSNGKVVIATSKGLVRYNADGALDSTFGTSNTGVVGGISAAAVAVQSDGKIVAVVAADPGLDDQTKQFVVRRYLSNGTPDTSFSGDGKAVFQHTSGGSGIFGADPHAGQELAIQSDGKIVVVGRMQNGSLFSSADFDFTVVRFNGNGSLDTSFASGGVRFAGFGSDDYANAVAIDSSNRIVVTGRSGAGSIAVARLTSTGAMDTSFSGDGKVTMSQANLRLSANSLLIQSTGKVVVAGRAESTSTNQGNFIVARFTTSGALDTTFGPGGIGSSQVDMFGDDTATDIVTTFGGKLLVGGHTGYFGMLVMSSDGIRDAGVGNQGRILSSFGSATEGLNALALAPGNKFYAVGTYKGSSSDVALGRYLDFGPTVFIDKDDQTTTSEFAGAIPVVFKRSEVLPIPTRVYYFVSGTASGPGSTSSEFTDYTGIPSSPALRYIDIPANSSHVVLFITPKDDNRVEATETVIFTALSSDRYTAAPQNLTLFIVDNDTAQAFPARVNFQTTTSVGFVGYEPDTGARFGGRGNFSYGWNADNSATMRDRNSNLSANELYDTLAHMQFNGANIRWDMAVPNGTYSVHIVAGDANNFDSIYRISAEDVLAVNGTPTTGNRWIEGTVTVNVTDGLLSIRNAAGSSNNKINFIEVTRVSSATSAANVLLNSKSVVAMPLERSKELFDKLVDSSLRA